MAALVAPVRLGLALALVREERTMTACIIYARFSPRPNAADCDSIEKQLAACQAKAAAQGYEVRGTFCDAALSGADEERPGLWDAIGACQRGFVLLAYDHSRIARNVYLSEIVQRALVQAGARLETVVAGMETTNEDTLVRQILQVLAEYQRKVGAARTAAAMRRRQAAGDNMSGLKSCPYGWAPDPTNPKRMVKSEKEAPTLARIEELWREPRGPAAICRALTAEGRPTRTGGPWQNSTIRYIIKRKGWKR